MKEKTATDLRACEPHLPFPKGSFPYTYGRASAAKPLTRAASPRHMNPPSQEPPVQLAHFIEGDEVDHGVVLVGVVEFLEGEDDRLLDLGIGGMASERGTGLVESEDEEIGVGGHATTPRASRVAHLRMGPRMDGRT